MNYIGTQMYTSEYSFVSNFLPLFQRFDDLTDIITRRVRSYTLKFARICACICASVYAGANVSCACAREFTREFVCTRLRVLMCARVVDVHVCAGRVYEWVLRGCATMPGFKRLDKNKKKSPITPY